MLLDEYGRDRFLKLIEDPNHQVLRVRVKDPHWNGETEGVVVMWLGNAPNHADHVHVLFPSGRRYAFFTSQLEAVEPGDSHVQHDREVLKGAIALGLQHIRERKELVDPEDLKAIADACKPLVERVSTGERVPSRQDIDLLCAAVQAFQEILS